MRSLPADPFVPGERFAIPPTGDGILSGRSFAVKDVFDIEGRRTGLGLTGVHPPAAASAAVVDACLAAGAAFVGKSITDELAYSLFGENPSFGTPLNPAAPDRVPGGSSSGSASAVAQGLADFALGTDTAGSIRVPASFNGLYGLRTTLGAVATDGLHHLARSFDTIGWLTRESGMLATVTSALLDQPATPPFKTAVLCEWAFSETSAGDAHRALATSWAKARGLFLEHQNEPIAEVGQILAAFRTIQGFEAFATQGRRLDQPGLSLAPDIVARLQAGRDISRAAYEDAKAWQGRLIEMVKSRLDPAALYLLPSAPPPPKLGQAGAEREAARAAILRLTCLAGMAGLPQMTVPSISTAEGPVGLGVISWWGSDRALAAAATSPGTLCIGSTT